jgi:2-polyprenyl-6-methoxyphenol hydroxylase-like FAD-dependent oxidoreductase
MGTDSDTLATPVLIVGGGPVGLMTALSLDALGVASILVNTEPTTRWVPKGSTQNARTLEHYRRLGLARAIRNLGLPPDYPTDVGYFTRVNGFELARIPMPSEAAKRRALASAPADDQVPEPLLRCNQMYVERYLLDHARTRPHITLRYGWECIDWRDDGGGVTARDRRGGVRPPSRRPGAIPRRLRRAAEHVAPPPRHPL